MKLDLSDTVKLYGIILMLLAVAFSITSLLNKGFSFRMIFWGVVFIIGFISFLSGFTFLRKNSAWRKKRGM